jgi:hypothetical protein
MNSQKKLLQHIRHTHYNYKQSIDKTLDKCVSVLDFQCIEYCLILGADINSTNYGVPPLLRIYTMILEEPVGSKILTDFPDYFDILVRDAKYDMTLPSNVYFSFIYNSATSTITSVYLSYSEVHKSKFISDSVAIYSYLIKKTNIKNIMNYVYNIINDNFPDIFEKNLELSLIIKQLNLYGDILMLTSDTSESSEEDISELCKICMTCKKDTIMIPCGHYITCGDCAGIDTKCPMCRTAVQHRYKVFE